MNRDELSVHADQLQIEGDIRGDIIALELLDLARRPDLAARHHALMVKWLGVEALSWGDVRFAYGFVDCRSPDLARVLASAAAPYLRSVTLTDNNTEIHAAASMLAAAPRPWLSHLVITTGRRWGDRRVARKALLEDDLSGALVAATPRLEFLDVTGSRVFDEFSHPCVQRLRVIGYDAIDALAHAGPAMPSVHALFYAFTNDPSGRVVFGENGLPKTLLARTTLPSLTSLDVSANQLQRSWVDHRVNLFELLSELGVLPFLTSLRVPPISSDAEREAVAHVRAISSTRVEDTSDRPSPLHDELDPYESLGVRVTPTASERRISLRRLGEWMSAAWATLEDDERDRWHSAWRTFREVPLEDAWYEDPVPPLMAPRADLEDLLVTLGDVVDDRFALIVAELARSTEPHVALRRHPH